MAFPWEVCSPHHTHVQRVFNPHHIRCRKSSIHGGQVLQLFDPHHIRCCKSSNYIGQVLQLFNPHHNKCCRSSPDITTCPGHFQPISQYVQPGLQPNSQYCCESSTHITTLLQVLNLQYHMCCKLRTCIASRAPAALHHVQQLQRLKFAESPHPASQRVVVPNNLVKPKLRAYFAARNKLHGNVVVSAIDTAPSSPWEPQLTSAHLSWPGNLQLL